MYKDLFPLVKWINGRDCISDLVKKAGTGKAGNNNPASTGMQRKCRHDLKCAGEQLLLNNGHKLCCAENEAAFACFYLNNGIHTGHQKH